MTRRNIRKAWRGVSFYSQMKAIFSYRKDVGNTELKLKGFIMFAQENSKEDFSGEELNNFQVKAEQARKEALTEKIDAVKWWKGVVAGFLVPIVAAVLQYLKPTIPVHESNGLIGIYVAVCIGIIIVTFHQMRTVALKGRLISLANSVLHEVEVLKGFSLHYGEIERECVYKTSNIAKFLNSVTRQNLRQMFSIIIIALGVLTFIFCYKYQNLYDLWKYIIS